AAMLSAPLEAWAAEGTQAPADPSGARAPAQAAGRGSVPPGGAVQTVPSFVSLAKAIENSVVNVQVRSKSPEARLRRQAPPFPFGPGPGPFGGPRTPRSPIPRQGRGSGLIVSEDAYILTNNHVVVDAEEVKVRLRDERDFTA